MDPKSALETAIDAVADGERVDWDSLESRAHSKADRELLTYLRLLADIADLHRSVDEAAAQATHTASTDVSAPPLRKWGRYSLLERVGEGSFGSVFRAWDTELEREVAVKLLHSRRFESSRDRVLGEARALARIRHPNVVNVFSVETHDEIAGLCMEFIHGTTLEDSLRLHGMLSAREAALIGRDVGRAVAAVHAAGFIHRDIKTRNVMREAKGRIVLMDFGTGRDSALLQAPGAGVAGTPVYMAPEVLSGSPASQKSDIYSVGVLLYHLVTGAYPTEGSTAAEVADAHVRGVRVPLVQRRPDLPDGFIRAVDRALAANPDERSSSAAELVHQLAALEHLDNGRVSKKRTVLRKLASGAIGTLSAAIAATLLGFITSAAFNVMLERSGFAGETPVDWAIWGLRSLIGPIGNVVQVLFVLFAAVLALRIARRLIPPLNRWWQAFKPRLARRLGVHEPSGVATWACVIAVAYFIIACVVHWRVISVLPSFISTMTPEELMVLSPANRAQHLAYRSTLDWLVLGTSWALFRIHRMRRGSEPPVDSILIITLVLTLAAGAALWAAPYRLMFQSERPRVEVNGHRCYDLGRQGTEMLIYCPDGAQTKVRRMPANDPGLRDTGVTESVFTLR